MLNGCYVSYSLNSLKRVLHALYRATFGGEGDIRSSDDGSRKL